MKKIFKKISAIAASALMVGMTAGVAAAANYPSPFVSGGNADVAIVYGSGQGVSSLDLVQAGNLQTNLQSYLAGTTGTSTSVTGEAATLYTGGTKIFISDILNKVRTVLTKADLPTVLADGTFSGNVNANYVQQITLGNNPNMTFAKQPASSNDPNIVLLYSTSPSSTPLYNATVTFSKAVNFTDANSQGQDLTLFGNKYTVSAATDGTNLVLLQSASKTDLSIGGSSPNQPTASITVGGKQYTVELISASSTSATIKVTDASGASESKSVSVASSKRINGILIAVTTASSSTNSGDRASIVAGTNKVTFTQGSYVKQGDSDTAIIGTYVDFSGGAPGAGVSKITVSMAAVDSDHDALQAGTNFVDPVFGTMQLSYNGLNVAEDPTWAGTASRETILVYPSGDDKMYVTFTDYLGHSINQRYAYYLKTGAGVNNSLYVDDNRANLSVREMRKNSLNDYVVVGNEDIAHLVKISSVFKSVNEGTTGSGDTLNFLDISTGDSYSTTFTSNTSTVATGTITIGGKAFTVYVEGQSGVVTNNAIYNISLKSPDSSSTQMILYPTIRTSKGANLAFYKPEGIDYRRWFNGTNSGSSNLSAILVPTGGGSNSYQTISFAAPNSTESDPTNSTGGLNVTCAGVTTFVRNNNGIGTNASSTSSTTCAITNTGFTYNISIGSDGQNLGVVSVALQSVAGNPLTDPEIMLYEAKDNNNVYNGLIAELKSGALISTNAMGINTVERTWASDSYGSTSGITLASSSTKAVKADKWGTEVLIDTGDSAHPKSTISYPNQQAYALLSMGAIGSSVGVTGGVAGAQLGSVLAKDTEVSSVSTKNLIVIGGSCINSVAANLVGAGCGSAWSTATGVGSGQFLIQSFAGKYTTGKIALLVAGYEAADTVNAATYLRTQTVDTTGGKKYVGTSATSAALVTTNSTA